MWDFTSAKITYSWTISGLCKYTLLYANMDSSYNIQNNTNKKNWKNTACSSKIKIGHDIYETNIYIREKYNTTTNINLASFLQLREQFMASYYK